MQSEPVDAIYLYRASRAPAGHLALRLHRRATRGLLLAMAAQAISEEVWCPQHAAGPSCRKLVEIPLRPFSALHATRVPDTPSPFIWWILQSYLVLHCQSLQQAQRINRAQNVLTHIMISCCCSAAAAPITHIAAAALAGPRRNSYIRNSIFRERER